jgi:AraC-like DNA-binding protein
MRHHALGQRIKEYGFFHYAVNEALHLSPREEKRVERLLRTIRREYRAPLDAFSQPVLLTQLELLLHYANRFYHRQFLTRQPANTDLLARFEAVVADYVHGSPLPEQGLPTVRYVAEQLHVSPAYLSDLLKKATGLNAQQHVHRVVIEKAKELLASSRLSVSEIAYRLGFEHSQSFSKLFKQKTRLTPLTFRQSFD